MKIIKYLCTLTFAISVIFLQGNIVDVLKKQSEALEKFSKFDLGQNFLKEVENLPVPPEKIEILYDNINHSAFSIDSLNTTKNSDLEDCDLLTFKQRFFYFTNYGTPLAYIAPLEVLSRNGFEINNSTKILDFGFGSIGQLLLFEKMGAKVTGIEVNPILEAIYKPYENDLNLQYGYFPAEEDIVDKVGRRYDLFISKNTLKKGYITPEIEVDEKYLINLGVTHKQFLKSVYDLLKPGGFFLIYNLHGKMSKENYKPWTDGRSPFKKALYEQIGFKIIEFDSNHTEFARKMGSALEWDKKMDFDKHLIATYTLLQK